MEEGHHGETISDIQNYLTTFNKEIQQATGSQIPAEMSHVFVDEMGRYFYQTMDGQSQQVVVVTEDPDEGTIKEVEEHTIQDTSQHAGDNSSATTVITDISVSPSTSASGSKLDTSGLMGVKSNNQSAADAANEAALQSLANTISVDDGILQQLAEGSDGSGPNQVILNTGNHNQIVTIVPSSTNPGEMSYVLIVEQSGDDANDKDHTVYDFNEGEDAVTFSDDEDDPTNKASGSTSRAPMRRSQSCSSQAHMCNYCNYTSTKRYLLARHMRSHSEERPHKCSVCDRGFKTLASLQNHLNTHTGVKPHKCKFCENGFTTSGELVRHVRYIHTREKPHKCPECDYSSVELSKLKRHMRCHTGERPYQCIHCTYASPDTFKLKRHLRIHTGEKPYECDICHARFTQSNSLKAHKLVHTGNKPVFTCQMCPTTCGRKTDLRIHIQKLHTSDKPIKCKKCTKVFSDRYTFKLHNKTHDGEKCFKCDLCPYASTSARHLDSHMLVHTEQKPYRCDMCEQSFRQKQLLRRHQNLYHNPQYIPPSPREKTQECHECGKAFRHKGNLIRHMAIHDPDASAQEKAQALKIGRQKRLQLINGQEVEVYTDDQDEDELMAVEGHDGNQYVVLEVIQLGENGGHHVMMAQGEDDMPAIHADSVTSPLVLPQQDPPINSALILTEDIKKETKKEMDTCFGFDDDSETGQIHLQFGE